jgi:hypothetical protein
MSMFAVHALLSIHEGNSDEATIEVGTLEEALEKVREVVARHPSFHAVSILHVESLPAIMEGAHTLGYPSPMATPPTVRD